MTHLARGPPTDLPHEGSRIHGGRTQKQRGKIGQWIIDTALQSKARKGERAWAWVQMIWSAEQQQWGPAADGQSKGDDGKKNSGPQFEKNFHVLSWQTKRGPLYSTEVRAFA